jgi:hypothetical protein
MYGFERRVKILLGWHFVKLGARNIGARNFAWGVAVLAECREQKGILANLSLKMDQLTGIETFELSQRKVEQMQKEDGNLKCACQNGNEVIDAFALF